MSNIARERESGETVPQGDLLMPWDEERFFQTLGKTDRENVWRFAANLPNKLYCDGCCVTSFVLLDSAESGEIERGELKSLVVLLAPDNWPSAEWINPLVELYFRVRKYYRKEFERQFTKVAWDTPFRRSKEGHGESNELMDRPQVLIRPKQPGNIEMIRLILRHPDDGLSIDVLGRLSRGEKPFLVARSTMAELGEKSPVREYLGKMKQGKAPLPSCYPPVTLQPWRNFLGIRI